jgi:hypothetical protein
MHENRFRSTFRLLCVAALLASCASWATACTGTKRLCRTPSEACPCPLTAHGERAVVLLADGASPAFTQAIEQLTDPETKVFDGEHLGLRGAGKPVVIVATYDAFGQVRKVGAYNLAGEGTSKARTKANAQLAAACLSRDAGEVAPPTASGDLPRALNPALAMATSNGPKGSALLVVGLGRSKLSTTADVKDDVAMDEIDLGTDEAKDHVVDVLHETGLVASPSPVAVTFIKPDEGVRNVITGGHLKEFAGAQLCKALASDFCQQVEVLS